MKINLIRPEQFRNLKIPQNSASLEEMDFLKEIHHLNPRRKIILCDYGSSLKNLQTLSALENLVKTPIPILLRKNMSIRSDPKIRRVPFGPCEEIDFNFAISKFDLEEKQNFQEKFFSKIFQADGKIWKNWLNFSSMITKENMVIFALQEFYKVTVNL